MSCIKSCHRIENIYKQVKFSSSIYRMQLKYLKFLKFFKSQYIENGYNPWLFSVSDDRLEKEFGFKSIEDCGFKFPDNLQSKLPSPVCEMLGCKNDRGIKSRGNLQTKHRCQVNESINDDKNTTPMVAKRKYSPRSSFCEKQINIMQNFFHTKSTYPEPQDLKIMIEKTGLNGYQIRKWFSNMRRRVAQWDRI